MSEIFIAPSTINESQAPLGAQFVIDSFRSYKELNKKYLTVEDYKYSGPTALYIPGLRRLALCAGVASAPAYPEAERGNTKKPPALPIHDLRFTIY